MKSSDLSPLESNILSILNSGPLSRSEIVEKNLSEASDTLHSITMLELNGDIELISGKYVKI